MRLRCLTLALLLAAPVAGAQVTETPVPFDTAGRLQTITPTLAARLHLAAPAWPVLGSFSDARLYARSDSGYTLVVARGNGAFDRYALDAAGAAALRELVQSALARGGRGGVGEQTSLSSEPAANAFVRNQAALGILLYGPAAAAALRSSTRDGSTALATELIVAGGTFFAALGSRGMSPPVTTAQNILATQLAVQGAIIGGNLAAVGKASPSSQALGVLGGGIGGTVLGLVAARRMTDAEAASSAFGGELAALTTLGVGGIAGAYDRNHRSHDATTVAAAGMAAVGWALGPAYPRHASYTVTAGDVSALGVTTLLGVGIAATPLMRDDNGIGSRTGAALLTTGLLGGAMLGDRFFVRPHDHTRSEGALLWTGTIAGTLVGFGVATSGQPDSRTAWIVGMSGGLLGLVATEAALHPAPGGATARGGIQAADAGVSRVTPRTRRVEVHVDPIAAAFAATRTHGRFPVMRVSF